jgi:hypothetical protein
MKDFTEKCEKLIKFAAKKFRVSSRYSRVIMLSPSITLTFDFNIEVKGRHEMRAVFRGNLDPFIHYKTSARHIRLLIDDEATERYLEVIEKMISTRYRTRIEQVWIV